MTNVVCVLHGGCAVPEWLADVARTGRLYLTVNDPADHPYGAPPLGASVTENATPRGFAENVNAALSKVFVDDDQEAACVVNFDMQLEGSSLDALAGVLGDQPGVGVVGAVLQGTDGAPIFSVGTWPTPLKEFLRASGLRSPALVAAQRRLLRRRRGWAARNSAPAGAVRPLHSHEYLPWTCLAIRRQAWTDVGPLDERFPLYGEDIDWSLRCHQSRWGLVVSDCGSVVHFERATRGPRADSLYEVSHLELNRKWGWDASLQWQRRGLRARRSWPLRRWTEPLDWSHLTNIDASPRMNGAADDA